MRSYVQEQKPDFQGQKGNNQGQKTNYPPLNITSRPGLVALPTDKQVLSYPYLTAKRHSIGEKKAIPGNRQIGLPGMLPLGIRAETDRPSCIKSRAFPGVINTNTKAVAATALPIHVIIFSTLSII